VRKASYTAVFAALFCLLFPGCDIFNAPLKDFIKDATGRTEGLGHVILTDHYMRADGTAAIPPADVSEHTIINVFLSNEQNYYLHITLTGEGSEYAGFTLSNDRRTILVTLLNQPREYVFDLTLNMTANDRPMPSVKLPRMECRYLDDQLAGLSVSEIELSPPFRPDTTAYAVSLPHEIPSITLSGILPRFGACLIQDTRKNWTNDASEFTHTIPVGVSSIVSIKVIADSGKAKDYFIQINPFTITFNKNNSDLDSTESNPQTKMVAAPATTIDSLPTAPMRTGYTFIGWNTQANGSGTWFTATTPVTADITVYAQWTITVTFNKNNTDTGSTEASPTTKTVTYPATTIDALPTAPTRTGYTFIEWNTQANGSGTAFVQATTVSASITVYAQWKFDFFTSVAALKAWLDAQPANTVAEPYAVKLNTNSLTGIRTALDANSAKYVKLDLSGSTVTSIGSNAFFGCTSLIGVTIPASVTSIGSSAFSGCSGLTGALAIPDSVTSIGDRAFYDCSGLTGALTIPTGVTSIGIAAFNYCSGLTGALTIPAGVTSIGNQAFFHCSGLTGALTIPAGVTSIGSSAFSSCSGLTGALTIPDSVTSIGDWAFQNCSGLTGALTIPDSITSIESYAFSGCSGLTGTLTIPAGVTSIGNSAFADCIRLTGALTIPAGVTSIGYQAFLNCSGLTGALTIPDSVTSIGSYAFSGCRRLTNVIFQGTISAGNFDNNAFGSSGAFGYIGDLREKYLANGIGTYTRSDTSSTTWTKSEEQANVYTVAFNKNNNDSVSTNANPQTKTVTVPATTIDALPTAPTRTGYIFNGWNTQANGNGTPFTATTAVMANITVYAQWIKLDMIYVPGGSFQMGDVKNEGMIYERPVHTVTLTGFYMGKYEVTQAQYQAVMGTNPSYFSSDPASGEIQENRPVEQVSWYDAIEFCNALSIKEGLSPYYSIDKVNKDPNNTDSSDTLKWTVMTNSAANGYRLPTEAQWEYAAKGGNGSPGNYTYAGSNTVGDVAWYAINSDYKTHEVGKKAPNGLGLYDMSGNVYEWCWDWFGNYTNGSQDNPSGAVSGTFRVIRGGGWIYWVDDVRSTSRVNGTTTPLPSYRGNDAGFRLVRP